MRKYFAVILLAIFLCGCNNEVKPEITETNQTEATTAAETEEASEAVDTIKARLDSMAKEEYVINFEIFGIEIDRNETERIIDVYKGSELAEERGWTDDALNNMVAVKAKYYAEYDHTKTFFDDGHTEQFFYVIKDNSTGGWEIADIASPNVMGTVKTENASTNTVTTTEATTVSSETTAEETTAKSEDTTVPLTETPYPDEVNDILKTIEQNSKTVGNDAAGYITVYAGQTYEEDEDGCFTVSSEDGKSNTYVFFIEGIQTDLYQTAYMICLTAVMNAEVDGFETNQINEINIDGMDGFLAVMADKDGDAGFQLYMTLVDSEKGILRALKHENPEYALENLVSSSTSFDSYRRSDG